MMGPHRSAGLSKATSSGLFQVKSWTERWLTLVTVGNRFLTLLVGGVGGGGSWRGVKQKKIVEIPELSSQGKS